MKTCFKCGETKDFTEFYKHPRMADGHLGKCKECTKKDVNKRYYSEPEKIKDYEKKRQQTRERRENKLKYQKISRTNHSDKYLARCMVSNAIRDGRLTKQPCEVCEAVKAEAHHDDYSKPLEVRWLCLKHHRQHHKEHDSFK